MAVNPRLMPAVTLAIDVALPWITRASVGTKINGTGPICTSIGGSGIVRKAVEANVQVTPACTVADTEMVAEMVLLTVALVTPTKGAHAAARWKLGETESVGVKDTPLALVQVMGLPPP